MCPFVNKVFAIMEQASWHMFQVLTKRADRLAKLTWPANVWMGGSIETTKEVATQRVDC